MSIRELRRVIPHPSTISKWRKDETEGIWDLGVRETPTGVALDTEKWFSFMLNQYYDELFDEYHDTTDFSFGDSTESIISGSDAVVEFAPFTTVVATLDYARAPSMTLAGLQFNHPSINQSSSRHYHVCNAFRESESTTVLQEHCADFFEFLNNETPVLVSLDDCGRDPEGIITTVEIPREALLDFSAWESCLGMYIC